VTARIAFRSPNWLGDAVMATVVPPALRRAAPDARIEVVAPAGVADVFAGAPGVDEIVPFPPGGEVDVYRSRGYDHVLLGPTSFGSAWRAWRGGVRRRHGFATSGRGVLLSGRLPAEAYRRDRHQVENYRALAGLLGDPRDTDEPSVCVQATWREGADRLWPASGGPRVVLQPGATYGLAKRWAPARFAEVGRALQAEGASVALVGGPGDRAAVDAVRGGLPTALDLCARTTVGELAAILEGADLVITNDTGPMHLAAAVGTPTVALFGSTSPEWTGPRGAGHRVLRHPVPCSPCFRRDCTIGYPCLTGIDAGEALEASRSLLRERTVR